MTAGLGRGSAYDGSGQVGCRTEVMVMAGNETVAMGASSMGGGQAPSLYLPGRYAREVQDQERPEAYAEADARGHVIVITNAHDYEARIPMDELRDMLAARRQKAIARGDAQRAADVNASLARFWESRKDWVVARRNNAIRMGWTRALEK